MKSAVWLLPRIFNVALAAMEPRAHHRKRSEGSFAVCDSIMLATGPSVCWGFLFVAIGIRFLGFQVPLGNKKNYAPAFSAVFVEIFSAPAALSSTSVAFLRCRWRCSVAISK